MEVRIQEIIGISFMLLEQYLLGLHPKDLLVEVDKELLIHS
jgi:hypothetical protein